MIRTKGEAGTGDGTEAVRHASTVLGDIRCHLQNMPVGYVHLRYEIGAPFEIVMETRSLGRMPVAGFCRRSGYTPPTRPLMMQLGVDGVFV